MDLKLGLADRTESAACAAYSKDTAGQEQAGDGIGMKHLTLRVPNVNLPIMASASEASNIIICELCDPSLMPTNGDFKKFQVNFCFRLFVVNDELILIFNSFNQ